METSLAILAIEPIPESNARQSHLSYNFLTFCKTASTASVDDAASFMAKIKKYDSIYS